LGSNISINKLRNRDQDAENAKENSQHYKDAAEIQNKQPSQNLSEDFHDSKLSIDKKKNSIPSVKSETFSAQSFQTAKTAGGFTNSGIDFGSHVSKEDVIFEKYV
jgi:hypothetical protein